MYKKVFECKEGDVFRFGDKAVKIYIMTMMYSILTIRFRSYYPTLMFITRDYTEANEDIEIDGIKLLFRGNYSSYD